MRDPVLPASTISMKETTVEGDGLGEADRLELSDKEGVIDVVAEGSGDWLGDTL